jgi:hypothetical protein
MFHALIATGIVSAAANCNHVQWPNLATDLSYHPHLVLSAQTAPTEKATAMLLALCVQLADLAHGTQQAVYHC